MTQERKSWVQGVLQGAGGKTPQPIHRPVDHQIASVKTNQQGVLSAFKALHMQLEALEGSQLELKRMLEAEGLGLEITIMPTTINGLIDLYGERG